MLKKLNSSVKTSIALMRLISLGYGASLLAQLVKNPPAMQETLVQFLSQEDPLEKRMATHSSILGLSWWLRQSKILVQCRDPGLIPGLGDPLGEVNPLQ